MDLYLRKVDHPQAHDNYRVILKDDVDELEIGSIGVKTFTSDDTAWTWGIDSAIPMPARETSGRGRDRADCMKRFKAAWLAFAADPARLTGFLTVKRNARRDRT